MPASQIEQRNLVGQPTVSSGRRKEMARRTPTDEELKKRLEARREYQRNYHIARKNAGLKQNRPNRNKYQTEYYQIKKAKEGMTPEQLVEVVDDAISEIGKANLSKAQVLKLLTVVAKYIEEK